MSITRQLRPHVDDAFAAAAAAAAAGDIEAAWRHLERAHILSQPSAWLHTRAHARMLVLGLRVGDTTEVVGQVIRVTFESAVVQHESGLGVKPCTPDRVHPV